MASGASAARAPEASRDFGEGARDVVEVTAEEPDRAVALEVELGANAVVLVLDPCLVPDAPHDLGGIGNRSGEHEADRPAEVEGGLAQPAIASKDRRLADLAGQHVGPPHRRKVRVERRRDRLLQQALTQADAGLAGRDPPDEARLLRGGA